MDKNDTIVSIKTEEQYIAFMKYLDIQGYRWYDNSLPSDGSVWSVHRDDYLCIRLDNSYSPGRITWGGQDNFIDEGCKITPCDDYMRGVKWGINLNHKLIQAIKNVSK